MEEAAGTTSTDESTTPDIKRKAALVGVAKNQNQPEELELPPSETFTEAQA